MRDPSDVAATLVAGGLGLPTAIRSGGHSVAGRSSSDGIILDVTPMGSVAVAAEVATVGAGVRLGELYDALATHGLTIPAGCGPSVGIAGLTLGGGLGILGRKHGLTCDHLPGVPHPPRARGHGVSADLAAGRGCRGGPGLAGLAPDAPDELDATLRLTAAGDGERPPGVEVVGSWSTGWAPTRWKRPAGTCPTGRPSATSRGSARSRSKSHVTRRIKPADH